MNKVRNFRNAVKNTFMESMECYTWLNEAQH